MIVSHLTLPWGVKLLWESRSPILIRSYIIEIESFGILWPVGILITTLVCHDRDFEICRQLSTITDFTRLST